MQALRMGATGATVGSKRVFPMLPQDLPKEKTLVPTPGATATMTMSMKNLTVGEKTEVRRGEEGGAT